MKKISTALLVSALSLACTISNAQTVIDYVAWSTNRCNAFGNTPVINGITHRTMMGQPIKSSNGGLILESDYNGTNQPRGTEFVIDYPFALFHQYQVKVLAEGPGNSLRPYLFVKPISGITTSQDICNGPESTGVLPNSQSAMPDFLGEYVMNFNATSPSTQLIFLTHPDFSSLNSYTSSPIKIRRITITDVTTNPPNFGLTSNTPTRNCGSELPVTFTINNYSNTPGVTGYKFLIEPGKWLYNGAPATDITTTSNTISLTPVACAGSGYVRGQIYFGGPSLLTQFVTVDKIIPNYIITGPSTLNGVSGNYKLNTNPIQFPPPASVIYCNTTPTWTLTPGYLAQMTMDGDTKVGISPYNGVNGSVVLSVTFKMCESTVTASREIAVSNPLSGIISKSLEHFSEPLKINRIYPNPTNGKIKIELNGYHEVLSVTISSVSGKQVINRTVTGSTIDVDLSTYAKGIYFLKVTQGDKVITEKIILE